MKLLAGADLVMEIRASEGPLVYYLSILASSLFYCRR